MTQQVRSVCRKHRRTTLWGSLIVLIAAGLAVALPAVAGTGDPLPPRSSPGLVMPTEDPSGGDTFRCSTGTEYKISNPRSTTYNTSVDGKPVTITLAISRTPNSLKDKYMSFKITGAAARTVAVNGGTKTALYSYAVPTTADGHGTGTPGVNIDTDATGEDQAAGIHATVQSDGSLYSISVTTFCLEPVVVISGTVYTDGDANGNYDGTPSGFPDVIDTSRTVTLNPGANEQVFTPAMLAAANGVYTFVVPAGGTYTVCASQTGSTAQTEPTGAPSCASGTAAGWVLNNLGGNQVDKDFGFAGGTPGVCNSLLSSGGGTTPRYEVVFSGAGCDQKIRGKQLVFQTWADSAGQYATVYPSVPGTGTCVMSDGAGCVLTLERLTWDVAAGTAPSAVKPLKYDDIGPTYGDVLRDMPFCLKDPRTGSGGLVLGGDAPDIVLPGTHTSCLIQTVQGPQDVNGTWKLQRVDIVYSAVDGFRFNG